MLKHIFLDLSKAFDSVCDKTLLEKLKTLGIRVPTLNWFILYLSEGFQYTCSPTIYKKRIGNWLLSMGREASDDIISSVYS